MSRTQGFQSLQPAFPLRGGRVRGDKRGQASLEVIPSVSGYPASHLGRDAGAGVAAALQQQRQQGDPGDLASSYQEETARAEPQQSARLVQCGADNVRGAKPAISFPAAAAGASPRGSAGSRGPFLLYFHLCF